jgi:hypothetical protein
MDSSAILAALQPLVPGAALEAGASVDFATIYVPADRLVETCLALRDAPALVPLDKAHVRHSQPIANGVTCAARPGQRH